MAGTDSFGRRFQKTRPWPSKRSFVPQRRSFDGGQIKLNSLGSEIVCCIIHVLEIIKKMNHRNKLYFSGTTFAVVLLALQGCFGSRDTPDSTLKTLAEKAVTVLDFNYNNGTVSPDYQYQVSYKVDFQGASLVTSVTKGNSVTEALPTPGTKSLTDEQLAQIRALFNEIRVGTCPFGYPSIGGGITRIDVYTSSPSIDSIIYISDCTGMRASGSYQTTAAETQSFTDYIQGL